MTKTKNRRKRSGAQPSEFGWTLRALMHKQHVKTTTRLSEVLTEDGYPVSQQMISRYINGQSPVPLGFLSQVIESLDLDEDDASTLIAKWAETLPPKERRVIAVGSSLQDN